MHRSDWTRHAQRLLQASAFADSRWWTDAPTRAKQVVFYRGNARL